MAKSKRGWVMAGVIGLMAYGGYRVADGMLGSNDSLSGDADDHVANQLWIGKLPKNDRDMIKHVVLLDHDSGRFGVWGQSSTWRHDFELFKWAREKERLLFFFPQTRKRARGKVKAWKCEGEAPKPFQLCLEIVHDGQKRLYYSREDWVVEPGDVAESLEEIVEDTPELDGFIDAIEDVEVDEI